MHSASGFKVGTNFLRRTLAVVCLAILALPDFAAAVEPAAWVGPAAIEVISVQTNRRNS